MSTRLRLVICVLATGLASASAADLQAQSVLYVKEGSTGTDCSSWAGACSDLQEALSIAQPGDEIWVAAGTYMPAEPGGSREATFQLLDGVGLYGGFAGDETQLEQRDWAANETILSGDLNGDDGPDFANYDENSYHVITGSGNDNSAIIDGFTITGGNADVLVLNNLGGGMYNENGSPTVTHCIFTANWAVGGGAGMYNISSSPTVTYCTFSGNSAHDGGGMFNNLNSSPIVDYCSFSSNTATHGGGMKNLDNSNPKVTHCSFVGNSAAANYGNGGGMFNQSCSPLVTNCIFRENLGQWSGGMKNIASSPIVTNCTFIGNSAWRGAGMGNFGGSPKVTNCTFSENEATVFDSGALYCADNNMAIITNCILWGNSPQEVSVANSDPTFAYCDIQGGLSGEGNIDADPLFDGGDLRLLPGSPCIDVGKNLALPLDTPDLDGDGNTTEPIPFDLEGNPRLGNGITDMGAYEQPADCNGNGLPDMQDILDGTSADCTGNWVPDECELDCNGNGTADCCDIAEGTSDDCNANRVPDECDIAQGTSQDSNGNGVPDECEHPQNVLYVKEGALGVGCSSWPDACSDLQDALAIALPGDEIWVAAGTYTPAGPGGWYRYDSFELISDVHLYGGFAGNETERSQRDWKVNETILSGDNNRNDGPNFANNGENSFHVVEAILTTTATLDGFTVSGGNANSFWIDFPNTKGGGMFISFGSVTVRNCLFTGNRADANGGAMFLSRSNSILINCTFSGNRASSTGGVFISLSSPMVTNCTFVGNSASMGAAAISASGGSPRVTNCTFVGNSGEKSFSSSGNSVNPGNPTVANCIFWDDTRFQIQDTAYGNTMVSYSCVKEGYPGVGNIDDDPLFIDAENGDLRLSAFSSAIDTGDNSVVTEPADLDGNPRIVDGNGDGSAVVDMGAYEAVYDPNDCNGNGVPDVDDIAGGTSQDCNGNGIPDECDIFAGTSRDCNGNSILDECDIFVGTSQDCNGNGVPDECDSDCNGNDIPDDCDILAGTSEDCNENVIPDECDILAGTSRDCNINGVPDECELGSEPWSLSSDPFPNDCNGNGVLDECDIAEGTSEDCNENGVPDECDLADSGISKDCNGNDIPDECDIADCPPDDPFCQDCNENDILDGCDITWGASEDCQPNGIPDECEQAPCAICDLNDDGRVDETDLRIMRKCLSQDAATTESDCEVADLDGDGRVTWRDWKLFMKCYEQYVDPKQTGTRDLPQRRMAPGRGISGTD